MGLPAEKLVSFTAFADRAISRPLERSGFQFEVGNFTPRTEYEWRRLLSEYRAKDRRRTRRGGVRGC